MPTTTTTSPITKAEEKQKEIKQTEQAVVAIEPEQKQLSILHNLNVYLSDLLDITARVSLGHTELSMVALRVSQDIKEVAQLEREMQARLNAERAFNKADLTEGDLSNLIANMKVLADGLFYEEKSGAGVRRIYFTKPDREANQYLMDRILGKPTQKAEVLSKEIKIIQFLGDEYGKVHLDENKTTNLG